MTTAVAASSLPTVRRILVIDDTPEIHEDFRKVLRGSAGSESLAATKAALFGGDAPSAAPPRPGFEIHSALQGQEGVAMANAARAAGSPYHVAFVDMRMPPGWDGLATIEALWAVDRDIQVVICTAYSDHALDNLAERFASSDRLLVLKKPFESAEILQLATTLSEKWAVERQVERRVASLEHDVRHDRLTGLPNRLLLSQRLEGCMKRRQRQPELHFALLYLDCDGFKMINDSLGHEVGDQLLVAIAERLQDSLRAYDLVAQSAVPSRIGGDEFLVLLENLRAVQDSALVAQRLLDGINQPFVIDGNTVTVTVSLGIATSDGGYAATAAMIRDADTAMYRAKAEGGGRYALFDREMHRDVRERFELIGGLRSAVRDERITLHYQPIVRLADQVLVGFEALARWQHPTRGAVPPAQFIPLAEEIGLIGPLGASVLGQACRQLADWRERYPARARDLRVSVNLSPRQLAMSDLTAGIVSTLDASAVEPGSLVLEVTEGVLMQPGSASVQVLDRLKALGVVLHMDDFGAGYSSLMHLCHLPIAALKIDRAFVAGAGENETHRLILEAIVSIGHGLGLTLIGEGIETPEQLALLQRLGVQLGQGYLLGRPVPAEEAERLLAR
jgi:diguanylate cyclase (GGDEF)-like protein